ncbi:MAG TPA: hypothetical protein VHW09_20060 [Bryobacteraceae bacterium]|jgi:hypothetical protein|nr:hypothetical protein [Bryobacteraceae bacterium]
MADTQLPAELAGLLKLAVSPKNEGFIVKARQSRFGVLKELKRLRHNALIHNAEADGLERFKGADTLEIIVL